jgi:alkylation response protein AidB-like acyl-CoA dehydrogenase
VNFDLSDDQRQLMDTVAAFVRKESPVSRLRTLREDPLGYSKKLWKRMGDLGWLRVAFTESVGGLGGTFTDVALIVEKMGTTLVSEPYIPSVVLAGSILAEAGSEAQRGRWLEPLMAGEMSLALAYAESAGRFDPLRVATRAQKVGCTYRIRGEKIFVLNGHAADALIITARTSGEDTDKGGLSLFVVDPMVPRLERRTIKTMDGHRAAMLAFHDVEVDQQNRLGPEGGAAAVVEWAIDRGAAAACSEATGIMQTALTMTRDYLCTREQFGVKIGTFQALQHRCVDMFIETELARSISILANIEVDSQDEVGRRAAVSAAKVQVAQSGRFVTQQAIQLHGGIGLSDEHDIGLYFKRMHVLNTLFGDEEYHIARFASLRSFESTSEKVSSVEPYRSRNADLRNLPVDVRGI